MKFFRLFLVFLFLTSCGPNPNSDTKEKSLPNGPKIKVITNWTIFAREEFPGGTTRGVRYIEIDGRLAIETSYGHGGSISIVPPR